MEAIIIIGVILAALILGPMTVKIFPKYERGVVFRRGKVRGVRGPGLFFSLPFIERVVKVDMRAITLDIPSMQAVTRDNVNLQTEAKIIFNVIDPIAAIVEVPSHLRATAEVSKDALYNILTRLESKELAFPETVGRTLQKTIDRQIRRWGHEVTEVKIGEIHFK